MGTAQKTHGLLPMEEYKTCPILIGSESNYVPPEERPLPELTHRWRCYVRATPGLVKAVQFRLHESFKVPYIGVGEEPFEIVEFGWESSRSRSRSHSSTTRR
jgi:YEATS domain-containing protein 4